MEGPGKYDAHLSEVLKKVGAKEGILIIIDGDKGPSFCAQTSLDNIVGTALALRVIADKIEKDFKEISSHERPNE